MEMTVMTRTLLLRISLVLLATSAAYGRADELPYSQVSRVPRVVDSGTLVDFAFDPVGRRIYAHSLEGVYWVDVREREPRVNGPILPKRSGAIEIAPDLGRLYFSKDREHLGYLDLRTHEKRILIGEEWRGGRLVYEPTRKELYSPTSVRSEILAVYDSETGKRTAEIKLPGFGVSALESVAGKVFFTLTNKAELYAIDAASHTVVPWRVNGQKIISPGRIEADLINQYLLIQHNRGVVAVDARTATVVGHITLPRGEGGTFAFDPEKRILVVPISEAPDHPRIHLRAYALDSKGFTPAGELPNTANEGGPVLSMHGGFIQQGHDSLLLWLAPESKR